MRLDEKTLHLDNTTYTTKYSYVPGEKENSTTMLLAGIKNGSDAEITYTYDARGNIKTVSEGGVLKQTYHYDELGQLVRMDDTVTNCTYGYRYNAGGNLTGMDVYDQYIDPDDPDYTSYNLLTTRDYRYQDSGNWKDLLTYYFGSTITYDYIGNPLNYRNGMTMTWEKGRRLASVSKSGVTTAYTYNDDGIRLTKKVGNNPIVTYETDGGLILCQKTGTGSNAVCVYFFYDASGNAYAMEYDGDMYYYLRNGQGDIIGIIDDTGAVVARYTYDPWGKPLAVKDGNGVDIAANATHVANVNPFRYRGYFYDVESGFYYVSSRYYDPEVGRFISPDTTDVLTATPMELTDKNLYAYCDNNPVVRVDHGGQFWDTVFDVISLGASIVEVCLNPTDPCAWAGLAGDAIDLIPFVTGVGEATRAVKTIDKVADTVQIAKAVEFTDDAADIVKTLDRSSGFTKSTASAGRKIHAGYKATDNFSSIGKEYRRINGIRPDYIDFNTRTIYELKPMNPRGVRSGIRQLQKYNKALGGGFNLRLELY